MQKLNIAILSYRSAPFGGGQGIYVHDISKALTLMGHQVDVISGPPYPNLDEKVNLMHIAICKLLEPYGYYEFEYVDKDGWPHYNLLTSLPQLKPGEQSVLMKEAIIDYFLKKGFIS